MVYNIDGIEVKCIGFELTKEKAKEYIDYVKKNDKQHLGDDKLEYVHLKMCADGKVDVDYQFHGKKYERIRRITGYLTGDLVTWNNAKRAEERERVKHDTEQWFTSSGRIKLGD